MTCPYSREDLSAYIDAEVDETTRAGMREHLRVCSSCRREVESLRTLARMVGDLPRVEPEESVTWHTERASLTAGPPLRCPVVLPEGSAYLDAELSDEEAQAVVAHLATCDPCYRAHKDIERITEILAETESVPAPEGLEERIVAAVEADRRAVVRRVVARIAERTTPALRFTVRVAAAAAFVLAVALAVRYVVVPRDTGPLTPVTDLSIAVAPDVTEEPSIDDVIVIPPAEQPTEGAVRGPEIARIPGARPERAGGGRAAAPSGRELPPVPASARRSGEGAPGAVPAPTVSAPPVDAPPPKPDSSPARRMMASVPPSQPGTPADLGRPGTSQPRSTLPKSAPAEKPVAPPERPPGPGPVRVADLPATGSTEPEAHVHVARSNPGMIGRTGSSAVDPDMLRAAEARLRSSLREFRRARPAEFTINP